MSNRDMEPTPAVEPGFDVNEYMWLGFIHFALDREDFIKGFEVETGESFISPPKTGLEAMIDKATGADQHNVGVMKKFVVWVTEEFWGVDYAPPVFFEKFKNKEP